VRAGETILSALGRRREKRTTRQDISILRSVEN